MLLSSVFIFLDTGNHTCYRTRAKGYRKGAQHTQSGTSNTDRWQMLGLLQHASPTQFARLQPAAALPSLVSSNTTHCLKTPLTPNVRRQSRDCLHSIQQSLPYTNREIKKLRRTATSTASSDSITPQSMATGNRETKPSATYSKQSVTTTTAGANSDHRSKGDLIVDGCGASSLALSDGTE